MPPPPEIRSSPSSSVKSGTNHNSQELLPPTFSIAPITASTLTAYRRLITLLLPIRYPDKFYKDSIADPTPSSLALCAQWPETLRPGKRKLDSLNDESASSTPANDGPGGIVVGGIQCRLEPLPCPPPTASPTTSTASSSPQQQLQNLYIQTLAVLSPYRSLGIATALLDAIVSTALIHYPPQNINVKEVYAHVWEANEEALEWYVKRGFEVGKEVVEGYYTKLRPSGARVVRKRVGVGDWVGAVGGWREDVEDRGEAMENDQSEGLVRKEGPGDG